MKFKSDAARREFYRLRKIRIVIRDKFGSTHQQIADDYGITIYQVRAIVEDYKSKERIFNKFGYRTFYSNGQVFDPDGLTCYSDCKTPEQQYYEIENEY